eukprot:462913_1
MTILQICHRIPAAHFVRLCSSAPQITLVARKRANKRQSGLPLKFAHPLLAAQLHPTKNTEGDPWNEVGRSRMKVWWQCSADPAHVWQTQICSRIRKNSGCPMCANKVRVPEGKDSFAGRFPVRQASASEFHPTKNAPHTPDRLHPHSHKRMWWQCAADPDHTWQVAIDSRARDPKPQCPFCLGRRFKADDSFAMAAPELAAELHPMKNGDLDPATVHPRSERVLWWQCPAEASHVYDLAVVARTKDKRNCLYCSGNRVNHTNSLASILPELSEKFHLAKNAPLTPDQVFWNSAQLVWWSRRDRAVCRTVKEIVEQYRTWQRSDMELPFEVPSPYWTAPSIEERGQHLANEFHPTKNGTLTVKTSCSASKEVWWRCQFDPTHEWCSRLRSRLSTGNRCPFCKKNERAMAKKIGLGVNQFTGRGGPWMSIGSPASLTRTYPRLGQQFHPSKNDFQSIQEVTIDSPKAFWWLCPVDVAHQWEATVADRVRNMLCPFCCGETLCETNTLAHVKPDTTKLLHPVKNGGLEADELFHKSDRLLWWRCTLCSGHEWESTIADTKGCPFCRGERCREGCSVAEKSPCILKFLGKNQRKKIAEMDFESGFETRWKCTENRRHAWRSSVHDMQRRGTLGCILCS